jgi:hypothetical protein
MKSRLGAILFGIGVLCVVLAGGFAFYVAPAVTKLPVELRLCKDAQDTDCLRPSVVEAANARFVQVKGDTKPPIAIRTGTLRATTEVMSRADLTAGLPAKLRDSAVVWNVYSTIKWAETGEMIQKSMTQAAIDRVTGAAASWAGQSLQDAGPTTPTTVDFSGQMYKFPFHTEKRSYPYFDAGLRQALPIEFEDTEQVLGLETYRFRQVIDERPIPSPAETMNALLATFAPAATGGRMTYSNTRTLWVEPVSGSVVKLEEQRAQTLVPDAGPRTPLLAGTFTFTDDTVKNSVESARTTRSQLLLISRNVPIGLAVLGALLLIGGLVLVTGRRSASEAASDDADAAPDDDQELRMSSSSERSSSRAPVTARPASSRAMGTRNGEQDT